MNTPEKKPLIEMKLGDWVARNCRVCYRRHERKNQCVIWRYPYAPVKGSERKIYARSLHCNGNPSMIHSLTIFEPSDIRAAFRTGEIPE